MRRVVVPSELLRVEPPADVPLPEAAAHYATRVLRLRPGDPIQLIDSNGLIAVGTLGPLNVVHVAQLTRSTAGESSLELGLLVGLPKGERWEWIIQKCTELGAHWIQPLYTERGDVTIPDTRLDRRLERWRRIAAEATRQCRRSQACHIVPPQSLSEALQALQEPSSLELRVVAAVSSPGGAADSLMGYMTTCAGASIRRATVLVGPEGGLTDAEVKAAMAATFTPVKLGPRVLRTETAAVAACTLLQAVWGDMR